MNKTKTFALLILLFLPLLSLPSSFADHGQEVILTLDYAHFLPVLVNESSNQTAQQVKVLVNYTTSDASVINETINAVMKVYTSNKTLIKTSSFPGGFTASSSDAQQLATVGEDHCCRLRRSQGVAHLGQLGFQRAAALAEEISPWCREADDRRCIVHLDTIREPVRRPGATQRLGALVELNSVPRLGEPCRSSQASQPAAYHNYGIGHQLVSDGSSSMAGA